MIALCQIDAQTTSRSNLTLGGFSAAMIPDASLNETIVIPQEARGLLLARFPLSVRLTHVLAARNFRLLGELHGLTYFEFSKIRNCGLKTLEEVRQFVRRV